MKTRRPLTGSLVLLLAFSTLTWLLAQCSSHESVPDSREIDRIISSLSLEEKAQVLVGVGRVMNLPDSIRRRMGRPENLEELGEDYAAMVRKVRQYVPGVAGNTAEFPEKGITAQVMADGPAGLRIQPTAEDSASVKYCTAFPIATLLASTWDQDLVYDVGRVIGNEALEYGVDILLAPGMNIQRNPLCGRNYEYYSEDPLVSGKIAAAMVKGVQSNGVGTSIKHFAANNQETQRMSVNTLVSERALRELYLKGFEIAVKESRPWTVMSSYNKLNGLYTAESHDLLTKVLRDDWGFGGYVVTDWGGGADVVEQMKAGNDLVMPGGTESIKTIVDAVREGRLEESVLDTNLRCYLGIMMKSPRYRHYPFSNHPDLEAHAGVTRRAATDGMVLLKNDDALPVSTKGATVAAFGNTSYDIISGGTGSGDVQEAYTVSMIEGLINDGLRPDSLLEEMYLKYIEETRERIGPPENWYLRMRGGKVPLPEMAVNRSLAQQAAQHADLALITLGRNSGEGSDRKAVEGDFYLNQAEREMITHVSEAFHSAGKKVLVVLNIGGVIETVSWRDEPDAILCAWQPGQEAGNSIADVITGKVNPSGRLAVTFPVSYEDCPAAGNFPGRKPADAGEEDEREDQSGFSFMRRVPWEVVYEEDIYVGYRYYNTFRVPVAYEFGYGLSYTAFEYSHLALSDRGWKGMLTLSTDVKNTGKVPGREVVQVYLSAPDGKLEKPADVLVAFGKTGLLQPGETETLSFTLHAMDIASFDEASSSWIVEAGDYTIKSGASSRDFRETASFTVSQELMVEKVSKALTPEREIAVLRKQSPTE
jgi:beta-glucosidase